MGVPAQYLTKGALVGAPASTEVALIAESDGTIKRLASDGTRTALGGGTVDPVYTVGADVQNYDITGLSGDTDGDYILSGRILIPNGASPVITVQPNQISANQDALTQSTPASGAPITSRISSILLNAMPTADAAGTPFVWFILRLTALSGRVRRFIVNGTDVTGSSTNVRRLITVVGEWSDTSTVITSLRIATTVAATIKAGSFFVLQRTGINT